METLDSRLTMIEPCSEHTQFVNRLKIKTGNGKYVHNLLTIKGDRSQLFGQKKQNTNFED
jgi:hypothetical protein